MSTSQALQNITKPASGDLSASQYCFVDIDTNGRAVLPSAGGAIAGILQNNDAKLLGDPCAIAIDGESQLKYGGSVTAGDVLKTDASGRGVTALAADIAAGSAVGRATVTGASGVYGACIIGAVGVANTFVVGDETVTSGALSAFASTSYLSVTGTQAYTLPNGKFNGQKKRIECSVAASVPVGTLTITTPFTSEQATYTFDTVNQAIELEWRTATGWHLTRKQRTGRKTFTVGTNNVGADDLHSNIDLSVTATVTSSLANGSVDGEMIHVTVSTAASTPSGSLTGSYRKKDGGTSATWGSGTTINATTAFTWLKWDQGDGRWHEINSATALYA